MLYEFAWAFPYVGAAISTTIDDSTFARKRVASGYPEAEGAREAEMIRGALVVNELLCLRHAPLISMFYSIAILTEAISNSAEPQALLNLLLCTLGLYLLIFAICRREYERERVMADWEGPRFSRKGVDWLSARGYVRALRLSVIFVAFAVTLVAKLMP